MLPQWRKAKSRIDTQSGALPGELNRRHGGCHQASSLFAFCCTQTVDLDSTDGGCGKPFRQTGRTTRDLGAAVTRLLPQLGRWRSRLATATFAPPKGLVAANASRAPTRESPPAPRSCCCCLTRAEHLVTLSRTAAKPKRQKGGPAKAVANNGRLGRGPARSYIKWSEVC